MQRCFNIRNLFWQYIYLNKRYNIYIIHAALLQHPQPLLALLLDMYVCMYVCICVCVCVCVCIYIYTYMHAHTHTHTHTHIHTYIHTYIHACMHAYIHTITFINLIFNIYISNISNIKCNMYIDIIYITYNMHNI